MADLDLTKLLQTKYKAASITTWNRLESAPRTHDFGRGLQAEIRDAMWMLARQWQFGEFQGEDAGSPVSAKVTGLHRTPDKIEVPGDRSYPFDADIPLEAIVERESFHPTLRLRLQMGRMFRKLLKSAGIDHSYSFFIPKFPLPDLSEDEDRNSRQLYQAVKGRVADGYALYEMASNDRSGFFSVLNDPELESSARSIIAQQVTGEFITWFEQLYFQPPDGQAAWNAERMEYDFKLNVPNRPNQQAFLAGDGYAGGRLDWKDLDLRHEPQNVFSTNAPFPGEQITDVFLPANVTFKGMPHPRFWQMEDGAMDFGKIERSPAGLVGLLLAEYGLTYSNDWFLLPYPMRTNSLCMVQGILVTDVFGHRNFVAPSRTTADNHWQAFAMFHLTQDKNRMSRNQVFYLPPVAGAMLESEPLERVYFMRDEMANYVWAIEDIVPAQSGGGRKILHSKINVEISPEEAPNPESWKYTLATTVPENWIPFIAVHKKNAPMEIRLQRARMPNAAPPQSVLLSETQPVHFVEENEVPRSGVIIERTVQRVRWRNGRTYCWIGRRKTTGLGEGSSELVFDRLG